MMRPGILLILRLCFPLEFQAVDGMADGEALGEHSRRAWGEQR
jgi:hypothetical protein